MRKVIKSLKLEIMDLNVEQRHDLYRLCTDCRDMVNRIWQLWECHHVMADSRSKIIEHLEKDRLWRVDKQGERPQWPVECFPELDGENKAGNAKTLCNHIEADLKAKWPHVHTRIRTLLANITFGKVSNQGSTKGSLKRWVAILLNHESRPSSTRPQPVPFDRQHSKLVPPAAGGNAVLSIRLDRDQRGKRGTSFVLPLELKTTGRASRYVKDVVRTATGEWQYKGSSLCFDATSRKWFVHVCCELPASDKVESVPGRTAFVGVGYAHPLQLRIDGDRSFLRGFGRGEAVGVVRRQLLTQRWNRQAIYRVAGSSNKGHGRQRAIQHVERLSARWKDFVKRYNHNVSHAIIERCKVTGVSVLWYFQPVSGRFLDTAGKFEGRHDSTGWDYFQLKTLLSYKCADAGIEFKTRKRGVKQKAENGCAMAR